MGLRVAFPTVDPRHLIRESVTLRDGRKVTLRPVRPSDAPRLMELHSRLSHESQYLRFFGAKPELSSEEAAWLAGVDLDRRFAIAACVREDGAERLVGVGRFDMGTEGTAEAAVVVRDDYQGQGLGSALLERLVEVARGRGVKAFVGEILAENERMLGMLDSAGVQAERAGDAVVRVSVPLDGPSLVVSVLKLVAPFTRVVNVMRPGSGERSERDNR